MVYVDDAAKYLDMDAFTSDTNNDVVNKNVDAFFATIHFKTVKKLVITML